MSAWSDWRCGALSDDEFKSAMARECADYDARHKYTCRDCSSWEQCAEQYLKENTPFCEEAFENGNELLFEEYADERRREEMSKL